VLTITAAPGTVDGQFIYGDLVLEFVDGTATVDDLTPPARAWLAAFGYQVAAAKSRAKRRPKREPTPAPADPPAPPTTL
jgi:hypothetical protein